MTFSQSRRSVLLLLLVGTAYAIANLLLRIHEVSGFTLVAYLHPDQQLLDEPWRFLLPFHIGAGFVRWSTTGLALQYFLEQASSPAAAYYCLNLLLVAVAGACAFRATRSVYACAVFLPFIAFGSQFYWYYQITAVGLFYLGYCYILINLLCVHELLFNTTSSSLWLRPIFLLSLVCLAVWFEQWLDYGGFLVALCMLTLFIRRKLTYINPQHCLFIFGSTLIILCLYLLGKFHFSSAQEHFQKGREAEMVLNYFSDLPFWQAVLMSVHDMFFNAARYLFMSLISPLMSLGCLPVLPLFSVGPANVAATQNGYHPECTQLTYYSHLFSWYLPVGMACVLFAQAIIKNLRTCFRSCEKSNYITLALLLMLLCGSLTHNFVKFRPYNSQPFLYYKVALGTLSTYILCARYLYMKTVGKSLRIKVLVCLILSSCLVGNALTFHELMIFMRDNVYSCERR